MQLEQQPYNNGARAQGKNDEICRDMSILQPGDIYDANDLNYGWKLVAERG